MALLAAVAIGYAIGSVSTAVLVGRALQGLDIRDWGSGNAGGSNAGKVLGHGAGLLVVLGDVVKGAAATIMGGFVTRSRTGAMAAGAAAVFGHILPVWFGFRGGKGIATFFGTCIVMAPTVTPLAGAAWVLFYLLFHSVALSSAIAAACLPVFGFAVGLSWEYLIYLAVMGYTMSIRHIPDVLRPHPTTLPRRLD